MQTIPIWLVVLVYAKDKWDLEAAGLFVFLPFAIIPAAAISFCLYWVINYGLYYLAILIMVPLYIAVYLAWKEYEFGAWISAPVYLEVYIFFIYIYNKIARAEDWNDYMNKKARAIVLLGGSSFIYILFNIGFFYLF